MVTKLVQKNPLRGAHEYEIDGEQLNVRVKMPFKREEQLTILLSVLNPEPVIGTSTLDFVSRVNGESLVSLRLAKPDPQTFNDFVNTLKQQATAEYNAFSGLRAGGESAAGLAGNSYEEPPEFDEPDGVIAPPPKEVRVADVDTAIRMLQTHLDSDQTAPLIAALEALRETPGDHAKLNKVAQVFGELGASQGAVLTYAPYLAFLLSDDPFDRS